MKICLLVVIHLSSILIFNCIAQQPSWEVISSGTTEDLNSIYFYDYQTGYACGNSGVIIKSVDSGKTWQSLQSLQRPISQNLNDIIMFEQDCFLTVGDSATYISSYDGGNTLFVDHSGLHFWKNFYSVSFSEYLQGVYYGVFGASSQTIISGTSSYCSTSLYNIQGRSSGGGFYGACTLTPGLGFVAGENSTFQPILGRTTDWGNNWEYVSFYLDGNEGKATGVDFTDQLVGYISARVWDGRGAISKTTDNGNNWTTTLFNNSLWGIDFPKSGTSKVGYCVGDSGTILKTYNAGGSWLQQISGTSEKLNKVYFLDPDFGFAVGKNGMILRTTTGGEPVTQVIANYLQVFDFKLEQNYPNPFNPSTTIKVRIPEAGFTSLKVFDVLGNEVATLVDYELQRGSYEFDFDANEFTSGIYFYQLRAGNEFLQTRKMLLLK